MMFDELVNAAIGVMFGSPKGPSEVGLKSWTSQVERETLRANGWKDWIPDYMGTFPEATPQQYARVWIWRPEWTSLPCDVDPRELDPQMNVAGLFWKPWRGSGE